MDSLLFSPSVIGPLTIRNRTIRAAAFEGMCPGNKPSEMLLEYHRSVAAGGIGMTTLAYASVNRSGLSFRHQLLLNKDAIPELRRITDAIHHEGSAASIQIGHCGNMSKKSVAGITPLTASGGLNIYSPTWAHTLNKDGINEIIIHFGEAVNIAREAGFDAVEVHAGHGYLISQFLSPYTNHRRDEYGGSLENRMRLMRASLRSVLKAAGNDIAVIVKMNMRDGFKGGMETDESIEVARALEAEGVHAIVLSGGFVSKAPMYVMRGAMPIRTLTYYMDDLLLKTGVRIAGKWMIKPVPYHELYFLKDALAFRKQINIPLIYVGGACSGENIDKVLGSGFEFVSMARALLTEPDFVNQLKADPLAISKCEHSNYCIARMYSKEMSCYQHREDIPEFLLKELKHHV